MSTSGLRLEVLPASLVLCFLDKPQVSKTSATQEAIVSSSRLWLMQVVSGNRGKPEEAVGYSKHEFKSNQLGKTDIWVSNHQLPFLWPLAIN